MLRYKRVIYVRWSGRIRSRMSGQSTVTPASRLSEPCGAANGFVDRHVILCHLRVREAAFEVGSATTAVQLAHTRDRFAQLIIGLAHESGFAVAQDLRHRSPPACNDRRPA